MNTPSLTISVPVYNEQESIQPFYDALAKIKLPVVPTIIFVNDGSTDNSMDVIKALATTDPHVKYIDFSRNFGKDPAMMAGMQASTSEFTVIMDVDLQDPPTLLPEMYHLLTTENLDCIATFRDTRQGEPLIRSWFAHRFYRLVNRLSKVDMVDGVRDFRMMNRVYVDAVLRLTEYNRFSKGLFSWVGFNVKYLGFANVERQTGHTHWSFFKLFGYAIDGIVDFSTALLDISTFLGGVTTITAFGYGLYILIRKLVNPALSVGGWTSLTLLILFFSGLILSFLGLIGKYIGKLYAEAKQRPVYLTRDTNLTAPPKQEPPVK